jgi:PITH domain
MVSLALKEGMNDGIGLLTSILFLDVSPSHHKVHSIKFTEFNNGNDPEINPSKIHLFLNKEVGFEDWQDVDPTQTLHLTAEDLKESADPTPLKYVKFQRVRNLTIFIEDNAGGDITALGALKFIGRPCENTNMADFKANKA